MRARLLIVSAAVVLVGTVATTAAQVLDRGEVAGTVRDESGAVLAGVAVTLRHIDTGLERSTRTNDAGRYVASLLTVGSYELRAERQGFATIHTQPMLITVGDAIVIDLVLPVAGVTHEVNVVATPLETPLVGTGLTLSRRSIETLPSNGRDYRDLALLAPTAQATQGSRGTFRVGGQPGDYLALQLDGADFTNNLYGEFFGSLENRNLTVPLEAVEEFQVSGGGFGIEFGRSNGGLVNVVTKSGTNIRRGSGATFLRHHKLTGRDAFGNAPTGLVRRQFAGSLGGPLVRNRTFYFLAAEFQRDTTPIHVRFARDVGGVAVPEMGIMDLGVLQGSYERQQTVTAALAKLDHTVSSAHHMSLRTSFSRNHGTNLAGGSTIVSRTADNLEASRNPGVSAVVALTSTVSDRTLADTRIQVSRETRPRAAQGSGPQVTIVDTGTFGQSQVLPSTQDMYRYQLSSMASTQRGEHAWKVGADYNAYNVRNNFFAQALNGAYAFPTLERFLAREPSLYTQYFGLGGVTAEETALLDSVWQTELAFYVQNQWRPAPRFSLSVGLRYDAQFNPAPHAATAGSIVAVGRPRREGNVVDVTRAPVPQHIPDDSNNWGPRVDVTHALTGRGATVLKGAAGVYYGRTPMIYFPLRGSGVTSTTIAAPPASFGVAFPAVLPSAIPPGSPLQSLIPRPSINYVDPGFQNPRVLQASGSVTHVFGPRVSMETGYLFSDSRNLRIGGFRSTLWDRNLSPPHSFDEYGRGTNIRAQPRLDDQIGQANALASFGRGRYHAFVAAMRVSPASNWRFEANYVLSSNKGNASTERDTEALMGPSDPFDLETDYGFNEMDQRHAFKAFLYSELPGRIVLASIWTAGSGLAFPVYSAVDVNGDGVVNGGQHPDRPVVNGRLLPRFPFHQPSWALWDLRVSKQFGAATGRHWQLIADAFNVLAAANTYADPRTNAVWGQPNFRKRNRTLGSRIVQLGVRVDF